MVKFNNEIMFSCFVIFLLFYTYIHRQELLLRHQTDKKRRNGKNNTEPLRLELIVI